MKYILLIIAICSLFICCDSRKDDAYFDVGEFSEEPYSDSLMRQMYSSDLRKLKESPLRNSQVSYTMRLSVFSHFHDSYCIRIDKLDSSVMVTFKILGDGPAFRPSGLSNLSMIYESGHPRMDSLFLELTGMADTYFSKLPDESLNGADGVVYLLESIDNGTYRVVRGWSGDSLTNDSLLALAFKIRSFVPAILLPSAEDLSQEEWFPILQGGPQEITSEKQ
jgi:hypothetical protein